MPRFEAMLTARNMVPCDSGALKYSRHQNGVIVVERHYCAVGKNQNISAARRSFQVACEKGIEAKGEGLRTSRR